MKVAELKEAPPQAITFADCVLEKHQVTEGNDKFPVEVKYRATLTDPHRTLLVTARFSRSHVEVHAVLNEHTIFGSGIGIVLDEALGLAESEAFRNLFGRWTQDKIEAEHALAQAQKRVRRRDEELWAKIYAQVVGVLLPIGVPEKAFGAARDAANYGLDELRRVRE